MKHIITWIYKIPEKYWWATILIGTLTLIFVGLSWWVKTILLAIVAFIAFGLFVYNGLKTIE